MIVSEISEGRWLASVTKTPNFPQKKTSTMSHTQHRLKDERHQRHGVDS
jgi:hypothetical protein